MATESMHRLRSLGFQTSDDACDEIERLRLALSLIRIDCDNLNHRKQDQHGASGDCPVEDRIAKLTHRGSTE